MNDQESANRPTRFDSNRGEKGSWTAKFNVWTILIVAVVGYVGFALYQTVYLNYKTSEQIKDLHAQQAKLEDDKSRLETLIVYYKTDTFQELEARKKLGLKMPGEKVIKVDVAQPTDTSAPAQATPAQKTTKPNWQVWLDYFSGKEI